MFKWMHTSQVMFMWSNDRMTKRWLLELAQKIVWNGITSSYLQKGHLRYESPLWAFSLGALEASSAMSTNVSQNMKICKPSFAPPNACMGKGWRWHGMTCIGKKSPIKTTHKWEINKIINFHESLKWFMDGTPSCPPFFLVWFRVFGMPMLNVGCC